MTQSVAQTVAQTAAQTEGEATMVAHFLDFYRSVRRAGKDAPFGQFLNVADATTREKGQAFLRSMIEHIAQEEIDEVEKKNETRLCPTCHKKTRHLGYRTKNVESSNGTLRPKRLYHECGRCHHRSCPADVILGLNDYTLGFRFLAVRAGSQRSYQLAADDLKVYCGLEVSHETIRMLCHAEAPKVQKWFAESPDVPKDFIATKGNVEITMDATKVNTLQGWRDVKLCIYSKRFLGEGVDISYWDKRTRTMLPDLQMRMAFAVIEKKDLFQRRVNHYRRVLRVGSTGDISVIADGAGWIWNIVREVFGNVRECLDVYHALEHLSKTSKALYGEGTEKSKQWYESTKWELLASGFETIEGRLDELDMEVKGSETAKQESLRLLREYLEYHRDRLRYRERLLEGRVIGSGQVEGACKSMIGRRLKQTNARWAVKRLNEMAVLCSVHYSDLWKKYWLHAN